MGGVDVVSRDWGACGLAYLTGLPDGPPDFSGAAMLARARLPAGLLVVDMSSMSAGPLGGRMLAMAGATVVKVESMLRRTAPALGRGPSSTG